MPRFPLIAMLALLPAAPLMAQECSVEDQESLDQCSTEAILTCRAAYPESCERHEATVSGALRRFAEQCCENRADNSRNRAGYEVCKRVFVRLTRPTQRLFGSEFAEAVRAEIRSHSYEDCGE